MAYLRTASKKCPMLLTLPNIQELRDRLEHLRNPLKRLEQYPGKNALQLELLRTVVESCIVRDIDESGQVKTTTQEAAHLLIDLFQEKQQLTLECVSQAHSQPVQPRIEIWKAGRLSHWLDAACGESSLRSYLGQRGHLLRAATRRSKVLVSELSLCVRSGFLDGECARDSLLFKALVTRWIVASHKVGHYLLADELYLQLEEIFPIFPANTQSGPGAQTKELEKKGGRNKKTANDSISGENAVWLRFSLKIAKNVNCFHKTVNFDTQALCLLKDLIDEFLPHNRHDGWWLGKVALNYFVSLSSLVGDRAPAEAIRSVEAWSGNENTHSSWKHPLRDAMTTIRAHIGHGWLSALYNEFLQAISPSQKDYPSSVQSSSLRCFKKMFQIEVQDSKHEAVCLFRSMLFELADNLQQCYGRDGNLTASEWFCTFRFQLAKVNRLDFLAAKHGMDHADLFRKSGRLSEAADQYRLVRSLLLDNFGDDYSEWLPNAPRPSLALRELGDHVET